MLDLRRWLFTVPWVVGLGKDLPFVHYQVFHWNCLRVARAWPRLCRLKISMASLNQAVGRLRHFELLSDGSFFLWIVLPAHLRVVKQRLHQSVPFTLERATCIRLSPHLVKQGETLRGVLAERRVFL